MPDTVKRCTVPTAKVGAGGGTREVVESPSLEVFKRPVDVAFSNVV